MKRHKTDKLKIAGPEKRELLIICTAAFLVPFMGSALNLALPEISRVFSMKAVTLTWISTAYLISTAVFQIPFARLADIVGRKKIFLWGVLIFSFSTFLCGFAPSEATLILLRFCSGIGSAMLFGTNIAILTALFPGEERGRVLGINSAVVYASAAIGPFFGGILTHYLGWHSIFFASALVGFAVFLLARIYLKREWTEAKGEKFDLAGSILYGIGLAGIIYGFSFLSHLRGVISLLIGVLSSLFFIFRERKMRFPVFNIGLFAENRVFGLSSLAALINYAATSAIGFMLSLYLQFVRGYDARHAGLILITQACVQSVFSLVAGRLTQRFDSAAMATTGMSVIVVGLAGLIFLQPDSHITYILGLLVLMGVGFGIFSSPNTNVIMGSVEPKSYNQASATTGTVRLTGSAVSMGIAGMTLSFGVGDNLITPELYPAFMKSMKITFLVFLVLCLLGVNASSARVKKKGTNYVNNTEYED